LRASLVLILSVVGLLGFQDILMSAVNDPMPAAGPPQPTPPGNEAIQAPEAPAVPLPPRPRVEPITVEELGLAMARLDRMIVFLVVVLAALVALFPVRNSDFWLYLAAARDWLGGKIALGQDAYSYTGHGPWINHSWLYGVLFYGLYHFLGGPAVVIAKAVISVALAILLLSVRRRGQSLWIPAVCTALAVLAISPRLLMQPAVMSFALLGVTVVVLMRYDLREPPAEDRKHRHPAPVPWLGEPGDRALWLLPALFALWVNLDAWFVVGPLAVALYLAGQLAQVFFGSGKPGAPRPGAWRPLAAVLLAGLAACLLSPFHVRGLTLPGEIGAGDVLAALRHDEVFGRMLYSPMQREYFSRPDLGLNIAGMAYYPLVLIGLISFAVSPSPFRWGRALLWGGFLALSLNSARAIPFFAVVAGPVAALNLQEAVAHRFGTTPVLTGWLRQWSMLGRALSVLAVFALVLLAWPGWLFGFRQESRRVGLGAEPPPGLVKLAEQVNEWRRDGTLTEQDRLLNLQPEVANGLAWLCPDHREQWFFDYRLDNYPADVAEDYVKLRRAFDPQAAESGKAKSLGEDVGEWGPILDRRKITVVIVYDGSGAAFERRRAHSAGAGLYLVPLYLDGHAAVYGRRAEPLKPQPNEYLTWLRAIGYGNILPALPPPVEDSGRFHGKEFDPWALAFGPKAEPLRADKPRPPRLPAWWTRYVYGPGPRAPETSDAAVYLDYASESAFRYHYEHIFRRNAGIAFSGLLGVGSVRTGSALGDALFFGLPWLKAMAPPPIDRDEFGPIYLGRAEPVVLAIRAARRAILRNPNDAEAYFHLGRAYVLLSRQTEERSFGSALALLPLLRNVQAVAALRIAVTLDPDLGIAHLWLAILFSRAHFNDLQLKHTNEFVRCLRRAGRQGAETEEQFKERLKGPEDTAKELDKRVKDTQNKYEIQSDRKTVFQKAQIALRLGLGDKALQVLLGSDDLEFGKEGTQLELNLLLSMGRLDDLREQLWPTKGDDVEKQRKAIPDGLNESLGIGTYERFRFLLAAAEGDYQEADEFLEQARTKTLGNAAQLRGFRQRLELEGKEPGPAKDLNIAQLLAVGVAEAIAEQARTDGILAMRAGWRMMRDLRLAAMMPMRMPLFLAGDYETLRGVLKLEAGDVGAAQEHFRQALFADKTRKGKPEDIVAEFPAAIAAYRYLYMTEKKE
jgi:tetratricopeptide (TPR) repeat protein